MKLKTHLATAVIAAIGGAYLFSQVRPPLKVVETKQVVKEQIVTVTKRVKQKDGTVVTETTKTEDRQTDKTKLATKPIGKKSSVYIYSTVPIFKNKKQEFGIAGTTPFVLGTYLYGHFQTDKQFSIGIGFSY